MFFEAWGLLLERADQVLRLQVRGHIDDPNARAQLDVVAAMLGDLGAMWPKLLDGLATETALLAAAAGGALIQGAQDPPASAPRLMDAHAEAVRGFADHLERIRELPPGERQSAIVAARGAILAAATAQSEIVDAAAARTADRPVRRI